MSVPRLRTAALIDGGRHTRAGMCGDPKNISTCSPAKRVGEVDSREAGNRSRVKLKREKIERCIAPNGSIPDSNRIEPSIYHTQMNRFKMEYNSQRNTNLDIFRTNVSI